MSTTNDQNERWKNHPFNTLKGKDFWKWEDERRAEEKRLGIKREVMTGAQFRAMLQEKMEKRDREKREQALGDQQNNQGNQTINPDHPEAA